MMGHHTYEGPRTYRYVYFVRKGRAHANRQIYAADHGVAFPDLLNTEADEGQLQHTKLDLLSSKINCTVLKWFEAHVVCDVIIIISL